LLESRGIHISTGEISKLSEEFLLRFYVFHKKHHSQTKKIFEKNGGYVLHLDGSAESGDEIAFTAKEGMTGFTIDSWIMPSESREYIKPFLESIRDKYGKPLAVVRDMSEEIKVSVSEVFPGVSQQVCHYHFVRNLGDIIFKHLYQEFRREILKTNILARILALKKICMDGISSQDRIVMAEHYWVMLAIEYVLYPRERKSDYPFVLPYLEVMNRLIEVLDMLKKIVMWNAWHNIGVKVVLKFEGYLKKLTETMEVKALHSKIKVIWGWFEEIRKVLRVSREFSTNEQDISPTKANEMEPEFNDMLMKIRDEGRKLGDEYVGISKRILQNCYDHMDELFVKVKDIHGEEIRIIRNNGIEELNHRWSRMHIRRRTGRSRTTMEMEKYGALLAVFSNIENEEYIKTVLDDVKDFVREMQEVTESEVLEARRLIRTFPQSPLIRSDSERPGILREFIRLIDDAFEDVLDGDVESWLSNF
jgi:Asp-tRNA(Asn)/Glu-tRNA(Gln) amidotransferase C subunit